MDIRLIGDKRAAKSLRMIARNLPIEQKDKIKQEIKELKNQMAKRIQSWGTRGGGGDLIAQLLQTGPYWTDRGTFSIGLRSNAPYSKFLEFGSNPGFLDASRKQRLLNWARIHIQYQITSAGKIWIPVGGVNRTKTYVKKGDSERQFFFNTVREWEFDQRIREASEDAIQETLNKIQGDK